MTIGCRAVESLAEYLVRHKKWELEKSSQLMNDIVVRFYKTLLEDGVPNEVARQILPKGNKVHE